MKIINLNSSIVDKNNNLFYKNLKDYEKEIDILNSDFWQSKKNHGPIFLVDRPTMNIIYPPRKVAGLKKPTFNNFNPENPFKKNNIEYDNKTRKTIAIGVHIGKFDLDKYDFDDDTKEKITEILINLDLTNELLKNNELYEIIFICPERIENIGKEPEYNKYSNATDVLFKKICLHEIAHGYMYQNINSVKIKNKWYQEYWGKLIEESLSNIIAWHLLPDKEKNIAQIFMDSQPFEYSAYQFWKQDGNIYSELKLIISRWLNGVVPFDSNHFYDLNQLFKYIPKNLFDYNSLKNKIFDLTFEDDRKTDSTISLFSKNNDESWEHLAEFIIQYMQMRDAFNKQILIHEIEGESLLNYPKLLDKGAKTFYWNDKLYKNLNIGDYVFVVNYQNDEILFCQLEKNDYHATLNNNSWNFTDDNGSTYSVSGKSDYKCFVKLKVISFKNYKTNKKWKSFGAGESSYINGENINLKTKANRIQNINYLKEIFTEPYFQILLNKCFNNFN